MNKRAIILMMAFLLVISMQLASATDITTCQVLSTACGNYVLTANIPATGNCLNVTADNVTINGAGYGLTGNTTGYGIFTTGTRTNLTIQNFASISNFSTAIYLTTTTASKIYNNTISNNINAGGNAGVYSDGGTLNITSNIFQGNNGRPISLITTGNNFMDNNKFLYNIFTTSSDLDGGGIVSIRNAADYTVFQNGNFSYNNVTMTGSTTLSGGGIIGMRNSYNNNVTDSYFYRNNVTARFTTQGGGFIGSYGGTTANNKWSNLIFTENTVTSASGGGIVHIVDNAGTLSGIQIINNSGTINDGIIKIDTSFTTAPTVQNVNITGNNFTFTGTGGAITASFRGTNYQNILIKDNILSGSNAHGLYIAGQNGTYYGIQVINNTAISPIYSVANLGTYGPVILNNPIATPTANNNLIIDAANVVGAMILEYNNSFGRIRWYGSSNLTISGPLVMDTDIIISDNYAYVNRTSSNNNLNNYANVSINETGTFSTPVILKDGVHCGNNCQNYTSLTGGKLETFKVWGFSNYSIAEGNDTSYPNITFVNPTNPSGAVILGTNITVNVSTRDTESGVKNITISLWDSIGNLVNSVSDVLSYLYYTFTGLTYGTYNVNATTCDNAGNCGASETRNITLMDSQNLTQCVLVDTPGATINITSNMVASGTCFTLSADNIIIEGNGYAMTGNGSGSAFTSSATRNNITIRNLSISNFSRGIYWGAAVSNSTMNNLNISSNNGDYTGIYLSSTASYGNSITNSLFYGNNASSNAGIYLRSANGQLTSAIIANITFSYNTINIGSTVSNGGLLLGSYSSSTPINANVNITNVTFLYNNVTATSASVRPLLGFEGAGLNNLNGATFTGNRIVPGTSITGAGIVGAYSSLTDTFNNIDITDNYVNVGGASTLGGAIFGCSQASTTCAVNNVTISDNVVSGSTLGLALFSSSSMTINNLNIINNNATYGTSNGGAISIGYAASASDTSNNVFSNINITGNNFTGTTMNGGAIGLRRTIANNFTNVNIWNNYLSGGASIFLTQVAGSTANNTFINLNAQTDSNGYSIIDATPTTMLNYLRYNNSNGDLRWLDNSANGLYANLTTYGALSYPSGNIGLSNNYVYINSTAFPGQKINSSANITLYSVPTNWTNPSILKDGVTCTSGCYNLTNLNAGTVIFNVTSWSNYSIGEFLSSDPFVYSVFPSSDGLWFNSQISLNFTESCPIPDSCWWTKDGGAINTSITCGNNVTNQTWNQGSNNVTYSMNNTLGVIASASRQFNVDSISPSMTIVYPLNTNYSINVSQLNYTIAESNPDSCWYSRDNGATNSTTVSAGTNFTSVTSIEGSNTWKLYCNDTLNNQNSTSMTFFKDTIYPLIDFYPTTQQSGEYLNHSSFFVELNISDTNVANYTFYLYNSTTSVNITTVQSTVPPIDFNGTCYQETANISTTCGELTIPSTGTYSFSVFSSGNGSMYINYTKPSGATNASTWKVRHGGSFLSGDNLTLSIPQDCWNAQSDKISFMINTYNTWPGSGPAYLWDASSYASCWNGANWENLSYSLGSGNSACGSSVGSRAPLATYDENWWDGSSAQNNSLVLNSGWAYSFAGSPAMCEWNLSYAAIFEEAMNWSISLQRPQITYMNLPDGIYYFNASVSDIVGNENSTSTRNVTIDTTNPGEILISPENNTYSNSSMQNFTVNLTDNIGIKNATLNIYNSTDLVNQTTTTYGEGVFNSLLGIVVSLVDGAYNWFYNVVDMAGNSFTTDNRTLTVDTSDPQLQFTDPTPLIGSILSQNSLPINVTSTDINLANITIDLYNSTGLVNSTFGTSSPLYVNITGLPDGIYFFNATSTDLANNKNSTETRNVTLDSTNPLIQFVSPTLDSGLLISVNQIAINVTSTDINLANITIDLYNSTGLVNSTFGTSSPLYVNITSLPDEIYFFNATSTDLANNKNSTETRNVTIDTTNPSIQFVIPTTISGLITIDTSISINVTSIDVHLANITIDLYNSTGLVNSTFGTSSPLYVNITSLPDEIYFFNATSIDLLGKSNSTSTRNVTIDTTNPLIQFVAPTPDDGANLSQDYMIANVSITETNFANITFSIYNLTSLVNQTTYSSIITTINWTSLPSTDYHYNVSIEDLAGNSNNTETRTIRLDYIGPDAILISPVNNTYSNSSMQNFTVNLTDNLGISNATLNIYNSTNLVNQTTISYGNGIVNKILGIAVYLVDGVYHWFYNVIDTAGNSFTTDNRTITVDTSTSSLNFISPTEENNAYINYPNLLINVNSSDINSGNITIMAYDNANSLINSSTGSSNPYSVNFTGLSVNKRYKFNATSIDLAGNTNYTETRSLRIDDAGTTITNSTVDDNTGEYSIIFDSNISFSTINTSAINNSVISYSTITNSLHTVINSTIINSTVDNSTVINSNVTNSTIMNSTINNSTLLNVTSNNCTMSNLILSNLVCQNNIIPGEIQFVAPTTANGNYSQNFILANVTATSFANITINIYNSTDLVNSTTSTSSPLYVNITSLADGNYHLNATRIDALGNTNSTETRSFILDTTNPIVVLNAPINNTLTTNPLITFNWSVVDTNAANSTLNVWNSTGSTIYNTTVNPSSIFTGICYQETANASTLSDGNCGLQYTGSYAFTPASGGTSWANPTNTYDGNYLTYGAISRGGMGSPGDVSMYINYTKVPGALSSSLWRLKVNLNIDNVTDANYSIPLGCFNQSNLQFRIDSHSDDLFESYVRSYCFNGATWTLIQSEQTNLGGTGVYEEAMVWNMSASTYTSQFTLPYDGRFYWNVHAYDLVGNNAWASSNSTLLLDTTSPIISIFSPVGSQGIQFLPFNATLNYSAIDANLDSCWYNSTINTSITYTTCNTLQSINIPNANQNTLYVYANDTSGNTAYNSTAFYIQVIDNGITYSSPVISGDSNVITGNFSIVAPPTSALLTYNNVNYTPSIAVNGKEYILTSNVVAPNVNASTNISFYYTIVTPLGSSTSTARNQTVNPLILNISSNCSSGFLFMNIINYDENTLVGINGTVEYDISMVNNLLQISHANGTSTGSNIQVCTNLNLSSSSALLNLQLRYYADGYMYETYNIQSGNSSYIPYLIDLYYLNNTVGTQFQIDYVDFEYITHPNAVIQVQRQYLADNTYKIVELPVISSEGVSQASFDTHNVRYKLIVTENGEILDIFDEVFPLCQNVILGTCTLTLRGAETPPVSTIGDFTYTITASNNTTTLTYIIPSGTPRSVTFSTVQNSRFIDNVSTCNTTQFASGGTIICGYNSTVGDSIVDTQIDVSGQPSLYGTIGVAEDLSGFFLGNNYVIAFFMLLSMVLMFIGSAMAMLIVAAIGIIYLSVVFLIKGGGVGFIVASMAWLIIAIGLAVYKISQKEERS